MDKRPLSSPQRLLNNGCVCAEGCEECDNLAGTVLDMHGALLLARQALNTVPRFPVKVLEGIDSYTVAAAIERALKRFNERKEKNPWTDSRETF